MLVGERHYVVMQVTLAAALAMSVGLFCKIATKISVFNISLKFFRDFLVDALSCPSRYNRPLNDVKKYFKMIFEVRLKKSSRGIYTRTKQLVSQRLWSHSNNTEHRWEIAAISISADIVGLYVVVHNCCRDAYTYHFLGFVSGLYFLYFIFHSIISLHRAQHPTALTWLISLVFLLVSCIEFLKEEEFWCFWPLLLFKFPFWELIMLQDKRTLICQHKTTKCFPKYQQPLKMSPSPETHHFSGRRHDAVPQSYFSTQTRPTLNSNCYSIIR